MLDGWLDVLMITYNRPRYTRLALSRLLATCADRMRVWVWHNGRDEETLEVVRTLAKDPRVHRFHHSEQNRYLRDPTNWFWTESHAPYLGKVDDDCLLPDGWAQTLLQAHRDVPDFGALGCWLFQPEDFRPELAERKIKAYPGGHKVLRNFWVGGSGYVMKRQCIAQEGLLRDADSFPAYCIRLSLRGYINGFYYPFIFQDHMDDPRSCNTNMRSEEAFRRQPSLSSLRFGTSSLAELVERARQAAIEVQAASIDPRDYVGWRARVRRLRTRLFQRSRIARFDA